LPARTALEVAVRAMYRPLRGVEKPPDGGEAFERLWRRLVEEPREEAALAPSIPALTPIEDEVSQRVRAQYEENPYPRWHRAPAAAPYPLAQMLRSLFPHLERIDAPDRPEVLVAGCGTGRHAAITAQLQPLGRVLAVDLSRASLAYAARRCRELGLANLRFAQADLLGLAGSRERFDLVECAGVLHHMADPLAGWRVLLSLLRPGGVMKLGLYSETGRRHIVAARRLAAGLGVREARRRILALAPGHPAREVAGLRDFYSASGARDLIAHVQEHRFTLAQLAQALEALGVEFLGFEFSDRAPMRAYRLRYPDDAAARSFENWADFEAEHPDTLAGMYQFWVRR
jgi:SAM-dependent methyltransferase